MGDRAVVGSVPPGTSIGSLESLFRDEAPALWRAVYAYTGGRREIADDAVAEAFALAIQHQSTIRRPMGWIYRTAFRAAARELRSEGRTPPVREHDQPRPAEEVQDLMSALRVLPPNQRAALVLHYLLDLPVREVARRLGISPATAKVHLHRGRNRLRRALGSEDVDA